MIEELNTPEREEEITRKVKSKKRIRGLLICINAVLASYLVFSLTCKIVSSIKTYSDSEGDIICLNGKNAEDSLEIYSRYIDGSSDVYDYGIYGNYLHLSNCKIEAGHYSSFDSIAVRNISTNTIFESSMNVAFDKEYLNGGIKLSNLNVGDHLLLDALLTTENFTNPQKGIKIRSRLGVNKVLYTLPNETNLRKKVTIKSKETSPCAVINVSETHSLPKDYYDLVLIGEENLRQTFKTNIPASLKLFETNSLADAYKVNSSYCIVLDDEKEKPLVSNYINYESDIFTKDSILNGETSLNNQDSNKYIRELGGYLTNAGSRIMEIDDSFIVAPYVGDHDLGKLTIITSSNTNYDEIKSLFS